MNWDAIGAVGEILGALAVFASLIYLALQIKQNTQSLRASAKHEATSRQLDYFDTLLGNRKRPVIPPCQQAAICAVTTR